MSSNSSGTRKRRKKGPSLTFKTPSEQKRAKSAIANRSTKSEIEKVDNSSVASSTTATRSGNVASGKATEKSVKSTKDAKKPAQRAAAVQTGPVKGREKIAKSSVQSDNEINTSKSSSHTNRNDSDKELSRSPKDSAKVQTKEGGKTAQQTERKNSKKGKRQFDQSSAITEKATGSSPKKRSRTSENTSEESSSKSPNKKVSQTRPEGSKETKKHSKDPVIPDRIQDLRVTKKAFEKWKPLAKTTIEFTEGTLKSIVLNVLAEIKGKGGEEAAHVLRTLKDRIMTRLPDLKAPYIQGDYKKMESQNERFEQQFLEKSREINTLDKKIEEEQSLLDADSTKEIELSEKLETCKEQLRNLKVHPLIKKSKSVLNLPDIPQEVGDVEEVSPMERTTEEQLRQSVLQLREKAANLGLTEWMTKLKTLTEDLHQENLTSK